MRSEIEFCYIGFRNSVSTASSFRGVSAKRRPGGTLCFLFQSKGHTICKKALNDLKSHTVPVAAAQTILALKPLRLCFSSADRIGPQRLFAASPPHCSAAVP